MAGWDRVSAILRMTNEMTTIECAVKDREQRVDGEDAALLEFRDVSFGYNDDQLVLEHVVSVFYPAWSTHSWDRREAEKRRPPR